MPSTDRLLEFATIVAAGSITAGAKAMGVPRATLSKRLSGLEHDLGVRLLHRGTRRMVLTEAGEELYRRARRLSADASAAWAAVQRLDDKPRGLLRVSVTSVSDNDLFTDFLADFPEIQLEVRVTTLHVDLVADGVDVAVRIGRVKDPNLIVKRVHTVFSTVVGAPDYLAQNGTPMVPSDLAGHACIVGFAGEWAPTRTWPLLDGGTFPVDGRLAGNSMMLTRAAVLRGQGLALMPGPVVARDVEAGSLVPVLQDSVGEEMPVSIVYADRKFIEPKVRVFVDRAAEAYAKAFGGPAQPLRPPYGAHEKES